MTSDDLKRRAAERAVELVEPGMRLGLGTGSTAAHFVRLLAERVRREDLNVVGVPTSQATQRLASESGVPLTTLDDTPELDLTVDGADELDHDLRLIKGGGGALLREKIVAAASKRMVVIADAAKLVDTLGTFPLPIEVVPFGQVATKLSIERVAGRLGLAGAISLRAVGDGPYRTDNGNLIYDCGFSAIPDPERLAAELAALPGVVEHGLFIDLCSAAIVASSEEVRVIGDG